MSFMRKLVTSGFKGGLLSRYAILAIAMIAWSPKMEGQQGCVMSCPPMEPPVQISLSSDCQDVLTYDLIGVVLENCPGEITVDILENGISIGDIITSEMIGNTYMVIVTHPQSGQSCMAMITVVDKQAPLVNCPNLPASINVASDGLFKSVAPPLTNNHPRKGTASKAGLSVVGSPLAASASASLL